jgi:hypothetical protein
MSIHKAMLDNYVHIQLIGIDQCPWKDELT